MVNKLADKTTSWVEVARPAGNAPREQGSVPVRRTSVKAVCLRGCGPRGCCNLLSTIVMLVLLFVLFIAVMFIASEFELREARKLPDTASIYESKAVCSTTNHTFPTLSAAKADGALVASCGECGQCSNAHDIQLYEDTAQTLTVSTTSCGIKAVFGGREASTSCMRDAVNLTSGCTDCWVDNIICDLSKCVFTCLLFRMGWGGSNNASDGEGELSKCLFCDERRCGPAFLHCSGANRRRSGLPSDIERNISHVCPHVDVGPGANFTPS